ncbi:transport ATP-binding protein CydD [Ameyamaea chiangmaiensis NBRC 103196]|uniref:Thiol reductant ABC exporter subunit CydC n=1 Tax=Ameyamaea chiangmaiensis TaxID=442969 RepID=A0A850P5H8_9PROT|nr:thiol reductant ABC exporter subunit CydC [Ameyamaea chiangmaiensis]MBS4073658.1 thiol reductant ABC exporter subunit CydC [Ameyamaea chiangmaiensis]NVN39074.1 thiol reductant ABC exporter subunit CydC [Ameyamaea chiangmaiensis]GBQ68911.1 transport ATP-binding protein CydD [Ameyamaea chiangmaiensis NBRC 103196]
MSRVQHTPLVDQRTAFAQIFGVWRPCMPRLAIGIVLSLLALLAGLELMWTAGLRLAGMAIGLWAVASIVLRLLGAGRVAGRYIERLFTHDAMFRALADLRVWFFRRLAAGSAAGLGFRRSGDLLSRLVSDVETLDGLYLRVVVPLCGAAVALALLLRAALPLAPGLAVVLAVLLLMAAIALPLVALRIGRHEGGSIAVAQAALRNGLIDLTAGLREIRAFEAEAGVASRIDVLDESLSRAQGQLARKLALAGAVSFLTGQAAIVAVLAALVGVGMTPLHPAAGCGLLFLTIAAFEASSGLTRAGVLAGTMGMAARRVVESADQPATLDRGTRPAPSGTDIALRNVSFRWSPDRPMVLRNVTLDIPSGSRVAILGPSGAGKSSLAALLLKVAVPEEGDILLGSEPLSTLRDDAVRSRIAWLSQATHLFDDTLRANLTLGRRDVTDDMLWRALDQAAIGDLVRGLPDGLETWIGEGGTRLSGGQGRRVALARTLLADAPILLLDEPTTGLDAQTAADFFSTLNDVAGDRTVIMIAHRLTGVERIDRVWRVADGQVMPAMA